MSRKRNPKLPHNKPLNNPVAILVEGIDWFHFLREQIQNKPEFASVQLFNFGSINQLDPFLDLFRDEPEIGKLRALGIMRDIEDETGVDSRVDVSNSLQTILHRYGFPAAEKPQDIKSNRSISVSYLLIPHDADTGCLEHAMLNAVKDERILKCAQEFYNCIDPDQLRNDNARAKMIVRSIIATTKKDGYTLGQSVHAGLWDLEHESVRVMLDFIHSLTSTLD